MMGGIPACQLRDMNGCRCIRKSNAATEILIATQFVAVSAATAVAIGIALAFGPKLLQLKLMA